MRRVRTFPLEHDPEKWMPVSEKIMLQQKIQTKTSAPFT
jgi:hypothetical protein